jgi:Tfp pilus assembly protein PilE
MPTFIHKGFTLIETLVYLALFTIIIGGFVAATYMMFETSARNQTKAMLQQETNFLIGKLNYALSGVDPAETIVPSAGASDSTLALTRYDDSTFTIFRSGTEMHLNSRPLNNSNTAISGLVFIHTYAGGTSPESIEAGFTITATTPTGMLLSQTASTTRYIRK